LILGLRGDYYSSVDRWGVSPRLATRFELFPSTVLKGGVGFFQQVPAMQFVDEQYGNPNLKLTRAIHYSVGAEQTIFENIELSLEGFYKDVDNVLTRSSRLIERDGEMVPEKFASDGRGRSFGLEVQLKHRPTDRFFGWLAYTLMKNERTDEPGGDWRLFDSDQTHILTAVASLSIGWGITAGLRFRLASGNPETPIIGSAYDADKDTHDPIYGKINSDRMPMFHQLDARVDKKWQWDLLALTVFADVQNVYNRKNPVAHLYSYDFSQKDYFYDLPIFPNVGLKLEY
jgi:outer membrane receptor protein involved in Fe transport